MGQLIWPVVMAAGFAALAVFAARRLRVLLRLRRDGTRVAGTVVSAERTPVVDKTVHVVFRFSTADGRDIEVTPEIKSRISGLRSGQRITVAYDPANPHNAAILDSKAQVFGYAGMIAGGAALCAASVFFVLA